MPLLTQILNEIRQRKREVNSVETDEQMIRAQAVLIQQYEKLIIELNRPFMFVKEQLKL